MEKRRHAPRFSRGGALKEGDKMELSELGIGDLESVFDLFFNCFKDDHYYAQVMEGEATREKMRELFLPALNHCLENGFCFGVVDGERLEGFILCFDYKRLRREHTDAFRAIFGVEDMGELPYAKGLHGKIESLNGEVMYILSIAVRPENRGMGMASALVDHIIAAYPDRFIVSDVSNEGSLEIYKARDFEITALDEGYFYIKRDPGPPGGGELQNRGNMLLLPESGLLRRWGIEHELVRSGVFLIGVEQGEEYGVTFFRQKDRAVTRADLVSIDYGALLEYQRRINICRFREEIRGGRLLYIQLESYTCEPLLNDTLREMMKKRSAEWSLIPDLFVSIPVEYSDPERLGTGNSDPTAEKLIKLLDYRTYYEAGIPSRADDVDDLAALKERISRSYLGKLAVKIFEEPTVDTYEHEADSIGPEALVDVYISVDKRSRCGVLTFVSMSCPFLLSHFLDNVARNQLTAVSGGREYNLFDFLKERFGIVKQGAAKSFIVIPREKSCLSTDQLASLIASETIYPDGESFGRIIDEEIVALASSEQGFGQYDRAYVCAYTNVVLQFSPELIGTVYQRLEDEAITLFYMELILFEEAAIRIANSQMVKLVSEYSARDPIEFLERVDRIYDDYSKTIDFWNIRVNYPTSQKSLTLLRTAFKTDELLEALNRSREHLQTVYDTKSDIVDRRNSKRMDVSLAVISFLAVFSAWIDGHDYIGTWSDTFPPAAIHIMQRCLFVLVLLTAVYALGRIFFGRDKLKPRRLNGGRKKDK